MKGLDVGSKNAVSKALILERARVSPFSLRAQQNLSCSAHLAHQKL
jgi:hypothetical protein